MTTTTPQFKTCMRIDVTGLLTNAFNDGGQSLDGFIDDGKPAPRSRVLAFLLRQLGDGRKFIPMGTCNNFDQIAGRCLGHNEDGSPAVLPDDLPLGPDVTDEQIAERVRQPMRPGLPFLSQRAIAEAAVDFGKVLRDQVRDPEQLAHAFAHIGLASDWALNGLPPITTPD